MARRTTARQLAERNFAQSSAATDAAVANLGGLRNYMFGPSRKNLLAADRAARDEAQANEILFGQKVQQAEVDQYKPFLQREMKQNLTAAGVSPEVMHGLGYQSEIAPNATAMESVNRQAANAMQDPRFSQQGIDMQAAAQEQQMQAAMRQQLDDEMAYGDLLRLGMPLADYQEVAQQVQTYSQGIQTAGFLADVVENTTPAQVAANPELKGEIETAVFSMFSTVQSLLESKQSTLREGEREIIADFLGNPASFLTGISTRDSVTIGKMNAIAGILEDKLGVTMSALPEITKAQLQPMMAPKERYQKFKTPAGVISDPQHIMDTKPELTPEEQDAQRVQQIINNPYQVM